jgi:outer membrane protein OmpA-like peptidoglycan-associated protein
VRIRDLEETPRQHTPRYIAGQDEEGPILSGFAFWLLSAVVLMALTAAAVFFGSNQVEAALQRDTLDYLRRAGFDDVDVQASGQDVELVGSVPTEEDLVALPETVANRPGVQRVVARLEVEESEVPEGPAPSDPMVLTLADDVLTVTGTLPSQSAINRVSTALADTGHQLDTEGLVIREGVPAVDEWMAAVLAITDRLNQEVDEFEIVVNADSGVATVSAVFESRQVRADVRRAAEDLFQDGPLAFVSALSLVDAPPPPPRQQVVELQENLDDLISGKVIEFEFNSDVLTRDGRRLLAEIVPALRQFPDVPVEIAGHADSVGSAEANMDLSRRRAQAVVDFLVERGQDPDRFVVTAYGDTRPIASNSTEEGRARNRRIEFIALEE